MTQSGEVAVKPGTEATMECLDQLMKEWFGHAEERYPVTMRAMLDVGFSSASAGAALHITAEEQSLAIREVLAGSHLTASDRSDLQRIAYDKVRELTLVLLEKGLGLRAASDLEYNMRKTFGDAIRLRMFV